MEVKVSYCLNYLQTKIKPEVKNPFRDGDFPGCCNKVFVIPDEFVKDVK
jgi:hypothetical protein